MSEAYYFLLSRLDGDWKNLHNRFFYSVIAVFSVAECFLMDLLTGVHDG